MAKKLTPEQRIERALEDFHAYKSTWNVMIGASPHHSSSRASTTRISKCIKRSNGRESKSRQGYWKASTARYGYDRPRRAAEAG